MGCGVLCRAVPWCALFRHPPHSHHCLFTKKRLQIRQPFVIVLPRGLLEESLDEFAPTHVIAYDPEPAVVRQLEVEPMRQSNVIFLLTFALCTAVFACQLRLTFFLFASIFEQ